MRLYNLSDATHTLLNIALRRAKISRFEDLNDPFELLGANLKDKRVRRAFRAAKKAIHENNGLICLSKTWRNPVMWSHYGDKHRGICLGFDVDDSLLKKVQYVKHPLKIDSPQRFDEEELTEKFRDKLLSTKFIDWSYEEEYRVFVQLDHSTNEGGLYFYEFSDQLVLKEIILGPRCTTSFEKTKHLASEFSQKVHVTKARIAFTKFGVTEDRSYRDNET